VKRFFDFSVSFLILMVFLPFALVISLAIVFESRGGVLYRQHRIGRKGVPFLLYKFRTMRSHSDQAGRLTVGKRDSRITRVGYLLRKGKLDEFPQFINVLLGEMSIVGPRPEVKEYVDLYTDEQRKVLDVKPGITDYASLEYFHENELLGESKDPQETYIQVIMPAKLELNKKYLLNPSIGQDLIIMWKTFQKMIR
jgi:lipopolysaccharide/colanic/teichoic acid biosynthesis glycosyltransferase